MEKGPSEQDWEDEVESYQKLTRSVLNPNWYLYKESVPSSQGQVAGLPYTTTGSNTASVSYNAGNVTTARQQ